MEELKKLAQQHPFTIPYVKRCLDERLGASPLFLTGTKGGINSLNQNCLACNYSQGENSYFNSRVQEDLQIEVELVSQNKRYEDGKFATLIKEACKECYNKGAPLTLASELVKIRKVEE